jgi:sialic acid synthase SpsE
MQIGRHSTDDRVVVIAEIGNNHEGDPDLAVRMLEEAAKAGADAVKFQTSVPELFVSSDQIERLALLNKFALSPETYQRLAERAKELEVAFISTPLDLKSAAFLEPLVDVFKVASSDNTFLPLLGYLAKTGKPVIISGGLADLTTLRDSVDHFRSCAAGPEAAEVAVLHCVSAYPTLAGDANVTALGELSGTFPLVGYSDHTLGWTACIMAVTLGARIIEKHFTLDKSQSSFRDHQLSADPQEFAELVLRVREAESMKGSGKKVPTAGEIEFAPQIRRSCAASGDLAAGTVIGSEHIIWVRPGTGVPVGQESGMLGRKLSRALRHGELFDLEAFE